MESEAGKDGFFDFIYVVDDRFLKLFKHRGINIEASGHGVTSMPRDSVNDDMAGVTTPVNKISKDYKASEFVHV